MPQPKAQAQSAVEASRVVVGPDSERFYCPHPGCNRSFAELWRLKVHYRAPPDVRGSGKERGHGTELKWCPKCGKDLKPGKHHVGCSAGKSAPRQAAKRQRQQMSTTTESEWVSSDHSDSLEAAVKRQATRRQLAQQSEASTADRRPAPPQQQQQSPVQQQPQQQQQRNDSCRLNNVRQCPETGDLVFTSFTGTTDFGLLIPAIKREPGAADVTLAAMPVLASSSTVAVPQQHGQQQHDLLGCGRSAAAVASADASVPQQSAFALAGNPADDDLDWLRAPSPLLAGLTASPLHPGMGGGGGGHGGGGQHVDDMDSLLRVPSPPPLPPDWEPHRTAVLFDFDQFIPGKRSQQQQQHAPPPPPPAARQPSVSAPLVTVTTAMNPQELTNPSDDYIWQILFAGENDPVPKRVTAHLHHHSPQRFDDDPLLDSLLGPDLAPHDPLPPHNAPPMLECIDAVLAGLHPTPLSDMMLLGDGDHQQQQPVPVPSQAHAARSAGGASAGSGEQSPTPDGTAPHPGSATHARLHGGEPIQQVPQAEQPLNGFANGQHVDPLRAQQPASGKLKPEAAPGTQLPPGHLPALEVGGADFFSGFL